MQKHTINLWQMLNTKNLTMGNQIQQQRTPAHPGDVTASLRHVTGAGPALRNQQTTLENTCRVRWARRAGGTVNMGDKCRCNTLTEYQTGAFYIHGPSGNWEESRQHCGQGINAFIIHSSWYRFTSTLDCRSGKDSSYPIGFLIKSLESN